MPKPPSIKAILVGTPLENVALQLRWLLNFPQRFRHPELWNIYLEEVHLPKVLEKLLKSDSSAVDIGAHIGSFTSQLLQLAPQGKHIAIEASPSKAAWLKKWFQRVEVHSVAVSDTDGTATFLEDTRMPGFSRLANRPANEHSACYPVTTSRLDSILNGRHVDLIKIDVEGLELAVLRGATKTIAQCRPSVLFECGPEPALAEQGVSRRDLFDFFTQELKYSIYTYSDVVFSKRGMEFSEFERCGLYPFLAFNFVALPL